MLIVVVVVVVVAAAAVVIVVVVVVGSSIPRSPFFTVVKYHWQELPQVSFVVTKMTLAVASANDSKGPPN